VRKSILPWVVSLVCWFPGLAVSDAVNCDRKTRQQWDEGEAKILRGVILPELVALPDYAQIRDAFEGAIANDPAAATPLAVMVGHANEDAACAAAAALGRFPSPEAATVLKRAFDTDTRDWVRSGALAGLERMRDPEVGALAVRALSDTAPQVQVAGAATLSSLGDGRYGAALVAYYDQHQDEPVILEWLGCVGDAPGSTVVRDRLLAEATNRALDFSKRVRAAHGLEQMGLADLVRRLLDREKGDQTHQSLGVVEGELHELAAKKGITIQSQAGVDALLRDADLGRHRQDMWNRAVRVKFIREGEIRASSDGPDGIPSNNDDLTTAESYSAWAFRVLPEQF
jgi:hypothetical protein